ncbi:MAG TPA: TonB-dependent receptor, partial [Rhodothermales bacterium]
NPDAIEVAPGIYTMPWRTDDVPAEWNGQAPIGIEELSAAIRRTGGPYLDSLDDTEFDPQVTVRYRPTDRLSLYARWAQAFKAGGFDTGSSSLPDSFEEFSFLPEYAENFEIGAKGDFWGDRARGSISLFNMEVKDMQIATTDVTDGVSQGSRSINAGRQRVRGVEFDVVAAVNEWFTVSVTGALMDGEMVEFTGAGCTEAEINAGLCDPETETIDRSGSQAPRTPDYKFTTKLDYSVPVLDRYLVNLNGTVSYSDGYIDDVEGFEQVVMWDPHEDVNLKLGFGDVEGAWEVSLWVRNLTESRPTYHREFDVDPDGREAKILSLGDFRTYGLQFQYNYF